MAGWTIPPSHLPREPPRQDPSFSHDITSTFSYPFEFDLSTEEQLVQWAQLEQLQFMHDQIGQEQQNKFEPFDFQLVDPQLLDQEGITCIQEHDFEDLQLPLDPDMGRSKYVVAPGLEMAAALPASKCIIGSINTTSKEIPLLCLVCPDKPRFSDVSHLLTHIASKGHLHHETQTKLRAHQDIAAEVTLREYDQWYRQYGIEALLVQRLKAKQVKEAARNKRSRPTSSASSIKPRKKSKQSANSTPIIKDEYDDFPIDQSVYPDFSNSDKDEAVVQGYRTGVDALALKGQVWPGMGKMDLANEEMKRTRNQRKPKSVIDKMRRTSEGIEPNQVVMTPEFEVERVRDVYDESSSPIPGQEESTPPRKVTRPRRRKQEPLAEVSTNIPRQRRTATRGETRAGKGVGSKLLYNDNATQSMSPALGSLRHGHDIFQDGSTLNAGFESRHPTFVTHNNQKLELPDRYQITTVNPISHSNLASPTPISRAVPSRLLGVNNENGGRSQMQAYAGSYSPQDINYALNDTSLYNTHMNHSFGVSTHYESASQAHFHPSSRDSMYSPQDSPSDLTTTNGTSNTSASQYIGLPGANPLYSHDRSFSHSYHQTPLSSAYTSLTFNPSNATDDYTHRSFDPNRLSGDAIVKAEARLSNEACDKNTKQSDDTNLSSRDQVWKEHTAGAAMVLHDDLDPEHLQL